MLARPTGIGTIANDDDPPPPPACGPVDVVVGLLQELLGGAQPRCAALP